MLTDRHFMFLKRIFKHSKEWVSGCYFSIKRQISKIAALKLNQGFTLTVIPHVDNKKKILQFKVSGTAMLLGSGGLAAVLLGGVLLLKTVLSVPGMCRTLDEQKAVIEAYAASNQELREALEDVLVIEGRISNMLNASETQAEPEYTAGSNGTQSISPSGTVPEDMLSLAGYIELFKFMLLEFAEEVEDWEERVQEYCAMVEATPNIWPTMGSITSGFGMREAVFGSYMSRGELITHTFHQGIDVANKAGTPIFAAAGGSVVQAGYYGSRGNMVVIEHGYGYRTIYAHLAQMHVQEGQQVVRGQIIGTMGSSGTATGAHLHYEVHLRGVPVDPMRYLPR